jgi:hypothetical protein
MRRRAIAFALLSAALFGAAPARQDPAGLDQPASSRRPSLPRRRNRPGRLARGSPRLQAGAQRPAWLTAAVIARVAEPALLMCRPGAPTARPRPAPQRRAVFTAVIAWVAFRENVDRRVFASMVAIVAGGAVLSFEKFRIDGSWESC